MTAVPNRSRCATRRSRLRSAGRFDFVGLIGLQPLAHAYDVINLEPDALVEFDHLPVGGPNLQVDLGATGLLEQSFRLGHNCSCQPLLLELGLDSQVLPDLGRKHAGGAGGADARS